MEDVFCNKIESVLPSFPVSVGDKFSLGAIVSFEFVCVEVFSSDTDKLVLGSAEDL